MSFATYNQNTPLQFFDRQNLTAERTILNNYVHDIVKNYGMDVLFVSQKKNFPIVPHADKPTEQNILFHAYGAYIKPEYNEPFLTRAYLKVDNDLFAIDQFGLSNDMSATLFFSKIDFAFDGAIALADTETITKTFKFRATINASDPTCKVSYKDRLVNFKIDFPFIQTNTNKRTEGQLLAFEISPDTVGNKYIYASFNRRYSAKYHVQDCTISVTYKTELFNSAANTVDIVGDITCSFVIKNPFKSYAEYEQKITPAVGDIVFIQTVDDKFEKLEITEVLAENKTMSGINPLLATYSYQCACKPYIADNAAESTAIDSPTAINANKLEVIDTISHHASSTGDQLSNYEQLYVDADNTPVHQDDVYGGYALTTTLPISMSKIALKTDEGQTLQHYFKWSLYANTKFNLAIANHSYPYTADELYYQLTNLFDSAITRTIVENNNLPSVDYSMCNLDTEPAYVDALNCRFYIANNNFGYLAHDTILNKIKTDTSILHAFIAANPELIAFVNASYNKGFKSPTKLPYLDSTILSDYVDVLNDKQPSNLVQVNGNKFTLVDSTYTAAGSTQIIVDLRDIERINIDSSTFDAMLAANASYMSVQPTEPAKIECKFIIGDLITVYEFNDGQHTRLATNGLKLFVETHDELNLIHRGLAAFNTDCNLTATTPYLDKTVVLRSDLSWLTADEFGIYFNPIVGEKQILSGTSDEFKIPTITELSYKYDITSEPLSELITFKSSPYYIKLTHDASALDVSSDTSQKCQLLYVPRLSDLT